MSLFSFLVPWRRTYRDGQVWSYKTRTGEEGSTVRLNKIEQDPALGRIFHISIHGVRIANAKAASGVTTDLPHLPVSEAAITSSVVACLRTEPARSEYMEGYRIWRADFDRGNAGIFTIPLAEIVSALAISTRGK